MIYVQNIMWYESCSNFTSHFNSLSVQWPLKVEFSDPKSVGLEGARNFYLHTDQQIKIGLWWVIVKSMWNFLICKITLFSTPLYYNNIMHIVKR